MLNNKKIFDLAESSQRILLLTDERIDGDTVGSALAAYHWLNDLGKDVRVYSPKPISKSFSFLAGYEAIEYDDALFNESYDLVMIFDCSDGEYIKSLLPNMPDPAPLVVFDHHGTNPMYGDINQVLAHASSTGEVLWKFFKTNKIKISKDMAQSLLTAIVWDTTVFSNDATNQVCMEAAAELGLAGAKMQEIVRSLYMNKSIPSLRIWGTEVQRLTELSDKMIVTCVRQKDLKETGAVDDDVQGISNFLIAIVEEASSVCVLRELKEGGVKGSLRTLNGDVAAIAQRFGGGGHVKASGFLIADATLECVNEEWGVRMPDGTMKTLQELFLDT